MKKIAPTKKVVAATPGDHDVFRLIGTPSTKHVEPMTKSQAIHEVACREGLGTAAILWQAARTGTTGHHLGYRRVT